jgi:hypothetical protein
MPAHTHLTPQVSPIHRHFPILIQSRHPAPHNPRPGTPSLHSRTHAPPLAGHPPHR